MPVKANRVKLSCKTCGKINYFTYRNKKKLREVRLTPSKHCPTCKAHTEHKEEK